MIAATETVVPLLGWRLIFTTRRKESVRAFRLIVSDPTLLPIRGDAIEMEGQAASLADLGQ